MNSPLPPVVRAFSACIAKRGLMDEENQRRLERRLVRARVGDLSGLRAWLAKEARPQVGRALGTILPERDDLVAGSHHLIAHLADGGMGSVWIAEHGGELLVVKTLKREVASNRDFALRFQREAAITRKLAHPNLVRSVDHGTDQRVGLWLAMEYVPGGDVAQLLKRGGYLNETEALGILVQVSRGLEFAHGLHLVHRDLKPANLFITDDGVVKVADFGLARAADESSALTIEGTVVGSPAYMAPEQIRGEPPDIRADLYACGCVLMACLTGRPPFSGQVSSMLSQHLKANPADVRTLRGEISEATAGIIQRLLKKRPADRFQSPSELRSALERALADLGGDAGATLSQETINGSTHLDAQQTVDLEEPVSSKPTAATPAEPAVAAPSAAAGMASVQAETYQSDEVLFQGSDIEPISGARLTLRHPDRDTLIVCIAGSSLVFGKLREPPVDLTLRDYPVADFQASCQRVSRQHFRIAYDLGLGSFCVEDLGTTNGTRIDARLAGSGERWPIAEGTPTTIGVPSGPTLRAVVHPRRTQRCDSLPRAPGEASVGLETDCLFDNVVFHRPLNCASLVYALVTRRLVIGGAGADIPLPGWTGADHELAFWSGIWVARSAGGPYRAIGVGQLAQGWTAQVGHVDDLR